MSFSAAGFSQLQNILDGPAAFRIDELTTSERGREFFEGGNRFTLAEGADRVANPGNEIEIRGLNDFLDASNQFRSGDRAFEGTTRQVGLNDAIAKNRKTASDSFDTAEGVLERRQLALGGNLSKRQKTAQDRRIGLGRAIADANAASGTRVQFRQRQQSAAKAAGGIEESLKDIESAGRISLSNAAGQERIRQDQARADKKSSTASFIGTVIGAAIAISGEEFKHDKRPIAAEGSLLKKLKGIRVDRWKYNGEDIDHVGPYAEEFNETFNVGKAHPKAINLVDAVGILMGSVKELDAKVEAHGA